MKQSNTPEGVSDDPVRRLLNAQAWARPARDKSPPQLVKPSFWSRYERLSFSMFSYTWGILILVVTALHFGNYHLETKTSSTSGSHSAFYGTASEFESSPAASQDDTDQGDNE